MEGAEVSVPPVAAAHSTIKLLCCVGTPIKCSPRPAVADSGSVGLHGDGCCEPEETASLLGSSAGSLPALALANQLPVNLKPPPPQEFFRADPGAYAGAETVRPCSCH